MPTVLGFIGRTGRGTLHFQIPQKLSTGCLLEHHCDKQECVVLLIPAEPRLLAAFIPLQAKNNKSGVFALL